MLFFAVLALATAGSWLAQRRRATWRDHARWGMAIAMTVAGVLHLANPEPFIQHLPPGVPGRELLVLASGLAEIGLGLGLLAPPALRPMAGRLLAAFLVAVFPANVYVAVAGIEVTGQPGGIYPWLRLPLQALFIAWALWSTASAAADTPPSPQEADSLTTGQEVACESPS
jgi:uncharacterized membrane protein